MRSGREDGHIREKRQERQPRDELRKVAARVC